MSIDILTKSPTPAMESAKHGPETKKKHKSLDGKKRKRDHEEGGHRSKSKKQKLDKISSKAYSTEPPSTASPFHVQTSSLYLPLAPVSQKFPLEGICAEHISPLILTYYPPFNGVVLSYSNPRLSERAFGNDGDTTLLKSMDEYAVSWAWVTAEFLLFKPEKGVWLEGYINLQNEGHLGLVCWNLFNASIERKRLPRDWKWIETEEEQNGEMEGQGETYAENGISYFVDADGHRIEGTVKFRVREIESSHDRERGFLSIEGTMLDDEGEKQLLDRDMEQAQGSNVSARMGLGGSKAWGATSLGVTVETDLVDVDRSGGNKHRRRY